MMNFHVDVQLLAPIPNLTIRGIREEGSEAHVESVVLTRAREKFHGIASELEPHTRSSG